MANRRKGITRFKIAPGYSDRKYKHIPEDEYEYEYNNNLLAHIRQLENAGYRATAPRARKLTRAAVNKRHGYPVEKKDKGEKRLSAWNQYVKENMPVLLRQGNTFRDGIKNLAERWKGEEGEIYKGLHELRAIIIR